ncbi:MAG TPA: 4Fe-4S dicluster domain-containing protein [Methanosarcinaceae archaeon]|nr:4Fe-4S dicluster domain-containing protein [Methanosarcinaceae archaeon]
MVEKREGYIVVLGCKKCGKCDNVCPTGALQKENGMVRINHGKCTLCMACVEVCPNKALVYME